MIFRTSLCCWTFVVFLVCHIQYGNARVDNLWCLQCTWTTLEDYYSLNGTNSTGDPLCSIADLTDITKFSPNPTAPYVNPMCTTDQKTYYERLLKGPCYDYACYALESKACVKWTVYHKGDFQNVTRMCAVVATERGCYSEDYDDGYTKEVCICDDQQFCNSGWTLQYVQGILLSCITSLLIWWQTGSLNHSS